MKKKKRIQLFEDFQAIPKEAPSPTKPKTVPDTKPKPSPIAPPDPFKPEKPRIKPVPLNISTEEEKVTVPSKPKTNPVTRPKPSPKPHPDPFKPEKPRVTPSPLNQIVDKFIDKYIELSSTNTKSKEIISKYEKKDF